MGKISVENKFNEKRRKTMSLLDGNKEEVFFSYVKENLYGERKVVVEDKNSEEYELYVSFESLDPLEFQEVSLKDAEIILPSLINIDFDLQFKLYRSLSNIEHLLRKTKYLESLLKEHNIDY